MGVDSAAYDTVLVLHVMCAIIGFGGVFLNGIYGVEAKRRGGREGLAVFEATERVGKVAEAFILAVPAFGIALVLMSHAQWSFSQPWLIASLAIYGGALALSFGLHLPNLRRIGSLLHELVATYELAPAIAGGPVSVEEEGVSPVTTASGPSSQPAELERRGKQAGIYGATLDLAIVAIVILMVWKPGG